MKLFNSKKFVAGAAIFLGAAAITSSALAAYIVTGGEKTDTVEKAPTEVEIQNDIVGVTAALQPGDLVLQPETAVPSGRVLTSTGQGNLALKLDISVEAPRVENIKDITVTVEAKNKAGEADNTEIGKYVVTPKVQTINAQTIKDAVVEAPNYKVTADLTWTWGESFGKTDPCSFYNTGAGSGKAASVVAEEMTAFQTTVADLKYIVTVSMA